MLGLGKKICGFCNQGVPARQTMRAPDRANGFVCRSCYEQWVRSGSTCIECHTRVAGAEDVGAFFEQHALGHADCGGVKLFA